MKNIYASVKQKINSWVYSDWMTGISIIFFVSSAVIACLKSLYELKEMYPSFDFSSIVNILILFLFFTSMTLAFLNDSVKESEKPPLPFKKK